MCFSTITRPDSILVNDISRAGDFRKKGRGGERWLEHPRDSIDEDFKRVGGVNWGCRIHAIYQQGSEDSMQVPSKNPLQKVDAITHNSDKFVVGSRGNESGFFSEAVDVRRFVAKLLSFFIHLK
ncbi:hypothetical protein CEXT_731641 [Caerostris extrusa]|uniref:Uncharacterized protein n=1 Tax=Caerostris extrusa TaxID=172846 RepID=A0AAV4R8E0_CAEEX|nr:hypothetical protein CEXT_731641 [Caerostris extrusa]